MFLAVVVALGFLLKATPDIQIILKHDSAAEQQTRDQLIRLLRQYDTGKFTFTKEIEIDETAIPHSHPVLTLHTRHLQQDDELLSTYLHEQLHWFLESRDADTRAAENDLRVVYPHVPFGNSDGAKDEESTYLHLIDCYLEEQADLQVLGKERTTAVMQFWANDHYKWVYRTVMQDGSQIAAILQKHHLLIA